MKDYLIQIEKIAEILNLGIPKKANNDYQMLCPFHNEVKPSFGINIEKGIYNCFSCGSSGHISDLYFKLIGNIIPITTSDLKYKIKTYIDKIPYSQKPKDYMGAITNRITKEELQEYTIKDIIDLIVTGHSVSPSGAKSNKDWEQQQIIMLDFDNKNTNYSRKEVLEYAKSINLNPTFSYFTFSSTKEKEKYRLVYCLEKPITDIFIYENVLNNLFYKFSKYEPDKQCKQLCTKFLGTNNKDIIHTNFIYKIDDKYSHIQLQELNNIISESTDKKSINNKINSISAKELLTMELSPLNAIVDNLLYEGFSIMAGAPKVGKSWACLDLCLSICNGKSFLGFTTHKYECLYLALEDSYHRLKDRINKMVNDENIPEGFNIAIKCNSLNSGLLEELELYLSENPNIKLIILDTLQKIRGTQNSNEGCYSYDYKEIGKLKDFADKHKICILAIHHLRKMKDSDVFNQISGSTGLTGAADTMIVLSKNENTKEVLLSITGRDVESIEKTIKFNTKTFKWDEIYNIEKNTNQMLYNGNPIVITIRKMLSINPNGFETTSNQLLKTIKEFTGTYPKQHTPQALTRYLNSDLQYLLLKYDGIYYESPNANGGTNGRKMFFSKPIIKELEKQQVTTNLQIEENK